MSGFTVIPVVRCIAGDAKYYIAKMKYGEVVANVGYALPSDEANTTDLVDHLISSEYRFLNSLVVAVTGGEPLFTPLTVEDTGGFLDGCDLGFGVLTFDGTQDFAVVDGRHRLIALKEALRNKRDLSKQDISVLLVVHRDNLEGNDPNRDSAKRQHEFNLHVITE